ncbi:receptor-like protein kinase FERONIA [Sesamum indicum]|uniref:non-specific serine/threonine protein kinase n=1 Tax=Sesamum indicum TaxID=4182 RepID=A0A6I9SSE1_SESIN|nr:receptor-like protein kinase FERONIA [Sesamum indicum]
MAFMILSLLLHSHLFSILAYQYSLASSRKIAVNCGSNGTSATTDYGEWIGDVPSEFTRSPLLRGSSVSSTVDMADADPVPYRYARISRFQFSYVFQEVSPGQKHIRLHFNPVSYRGFGMYRDLFIVQAGRLTLLGNFSASLTADALGLKYFVKEFWITVEENQTLRLKFSPARSLLHDTYAFVNGIEVIDMPTSLYYTHDNCLGAQFIGHNFHVLLDSSTVLEMVHQLNIQEESISQANSSGMLHSRITRKTNKINFFAWNVPVDVGFRYLVRLHLSEPQNYMEISGIMEFSVLINGKIADTKVDSARRRSHNDIHCYRDYVVMMNGHGQEGKRDLMIAMKTKSGLSDGPLARFEILKLSNLNNSLASLDPLPPSQTLSSRGLWKSILLLVSDHGNAVGSIVVAVGTLTTLVNYKLHKIAEAKWKKQSALTEGLRCFSLDEMQSATDNFSHTPIGRGSFGKVYRGLIDDGQRKVAIKKLTFGSHQGENEFWNEVEALSKLRHANVVSLIGYCYEREEMILVYELMPLGTLAANLFKNNITDNSLSWEQRLRICIGAARGLDYLHTNGVIHRDVKSSNILLDDEFRAKISDFGFAKLGETMQLHSYINTRIVGTNGYLDPDYMRNQRLTKKSDVYSFGVVLFEVLSGKRAVNSRGQDCQPDLISWARGHIRNGDIDKIVEPSLRGKMSLKCLKDFVEISEKCLHDEPKKRPTMVQVVAMLEFLHEEHVAGKSNSKMVQNRVAQDRGTQHLEAPLGSTQPKILKDSTRGAQVCVGGSSSSNEQFMLRPRKQFQRSKALTFPDGPCHHFSKFSIENATENFSDKCLIISNVFYKIYAGSYKSFGRNITIARFKCAQERIPAVCMELEMLSKLYHPNLACIIGYCCGDKGEIFIVYEYAGDNTLLHYLKTSNLSWKIRLFICIGVAQGLDYLHMRTGKTIIHGDVSPSVIFLDEGWCAKVVNFGSILSPSDVHDPALTWQTSLELQNMPPDFTYPTKFTEKSDVYLFGVLLLEVLCPEYLHNHLLLDRIRQAIKKKALGRIIDPYLHGKIEAKSLCEFLEVTFSCLQLEQVDRPPMDRVVSCLDEALWLQCDAEKRSLKDNENQDGFTLDNVYPELHHFASITLQNNQQSGITSSR